MGQTPAATTPGAVEAGRELLPGHWVEVLSAEEILRTLDEDHMLDGLPFMPEMLPHCGKRFRVALRAERTCVYPPEVPFRQLKGAVVLQGLRCDGSAHGGCQLGCMMFWKEAWLRRVPAGEAHAPAAAAPTAPTPEVSSPQAAPQPLLRVTRRSDPSLYVCQGTELPRATTPGDALWKPGQYLRMLKVRTLTLGQLTSMLSRAVLRRGGRMAKRALDRGRPAGAADAPAAASLGLQPGEWVVVRGREEIRRTLDAKGMYKGLPFGGDMYGYCGRRMRVRDRVERIVDERTGRPRTVRDTVILEGSVCERYMGCARGMPILWREAWLERAGAGPAAAGPSEAGPA